MQKCDTKVSSRVKADTGDFVPARKYKVKPKISHWFTPKLTAAIAHTNHFFRLYQRSTSVYNRRLFVSARNECKRFLNKPKALFAGGMRHCKISRMFSSRDYWRLCRDQVSIHPVFNMSALLAYAVFFNVHACNHCFQNVFFRYKIIFVSRKLIHTKTQM